MSVYVFNMEDLIPERSDTLKQVRFTWDPDKEIWLVSVGGITPSPDEANEWVRIAVSKKLLPPKGPGKKPPRP
jgi:hypothetical protein